MLVAKSLNAGNREISIQTTCHAGTHRSVAAAELIGRELRSGVCVWWFCIPIGAEDRETHGRMKLHGRLERGKFEIPISLAAWGDVKYVLMIMSNSILSCGGTLGF